MKVLHLTLKRKWFDMILSGEKKEEYREIKPYWLVRFINWTGAAKLLKINMCTSLKDENSAATWNFNNNYCQNIDYDLIIFKNGYSKTAPIIKVECLGVCIGQGLHKWGAEQDKRYFVLALGKIIKTNNL